LGQNRIIVNNIIVGAGASIRFWPGEGGTTLLDNSRLINDVIVNNSIIEPQNGNAFDIDKPIQSGLGHTNTRIANNLVLQSSGTLASVDTASGLTFDHNLWSRTPSSNVFSNTDVVANPLLVDPNHTRTAGTVSAEWYKLTSSSPAINKAAQIASVSEDYFRTLRGTSPDIGAHEYGGSPNPTTGATKTPTPTISGKKTGDVNGDGVVNILDFQLLSNSFGKSQGQTGYNANADFNGDNVVNILDFQILSNNFGK